MNLIKWGCDPLGNRLLRLHRQQALETLAEAASRSSTVPSTFSPLLMESRDWNNRTTHSGGCSCLGKGQQDPNRPSSSAAGRATPLATGIF